MKTVHILVFHEGENCIPCMYMEQVIAEITQDYGDAFAWEKESSSPMELVIFSGNKIFQSACEVVFSQFFHSALVPDPTSEHHFVNLQSL